jgi:hypothetical protein
MGAGIMIGAAKKAERCTESVADQVAHGIRSLGLPDAVAFAESFDVNDGTGHHLIIQFKICLTQDTS